MDSKYIREIDSEWIVNSGKNNKFKVNSRTDNELKLYKQTQYWIHSEFLKQIVSS